MHLGHPRPTLQPIPEAALEEREAERRGGGGGEGVGALSSQSLVPVLTLLSSPDLWLLLLLTALLAFNLHLVLQYVFHNLQPQESSLILVPGPLKLSAEPEEAGWSPGTHKVTETGHLTFPPHPAPSHHDLTPRGIVAWARHSSGPGSIPPFTGERAAAMGGKTSYQWRP